MGEVLAAGGGLWTMVFKLTEDCVFGLAFSGAGARVQLAVDYGL